MESVIDKDNRLPPQVRQLIKIIGVAETCILLRQLGGTSITIPNRLHPLMCIRQPLKRESLEALRREFDDQRVDLPKYDKIMMAIRDSKIREDLDKGVSVEDLSAKHNLSERQIRNIRIGTRGW
ncbi:MAG TPA: hypothetical protein ENI80_03425 [Acidiferrobacteraceae bacterium]|nr:hypothetical protein [Acidiferrobacteraceae bacterium]